MQTEITIMLIGKNIKPIVTCATFETAKSEGVEFQSQGINLQKTGRGPRGNWASNPPNALSMSTLTIF